MNNDSPGEQTSPQQADNQLRKRIRDVAYHALYCPRSIAGKYQWDPLMYTILYTQAVANEGQGTNNISFIDFITTFSKEFAPESDEDPGYGNTGKLSHHFQRFAKRLAYLEAYQAKDSDFVVDTLQDAFCGLMHSRYGWGGKGLPTKGIVTEMTKAHLAQQKKPIKKEWARSAWSNFLKIARLDWLPEDPPGRHKSKPDLDENMRAQRECHALLTLSAKKLHKGDWLKLRDQMKAALGNKSEYSRSERGRLNSQPETDSREQESE